MRTMSVVLLSCAILLAVSSCSRDTSNDLLAPSGEDVASYDIDKANGNPRIIPPVARVHGKTYAEWGVAWMQWFWSAPFDVSPALDETGEFISYGQSGSVWFLSPSFFEGTERFATIPTGKMLFIDIAADIEGTWLGTGETEEELRAVAAYAVDNLVSVTLTVDGNVLQNIELYRIQPAEPFSLTIPDNNLFQAFGFDMPAGTYDGAVYDGYFAMLAPLSAGQHTIVVSSEWGDPDPYFNDVTFYLTVQGP